MQEFQKSQTTLVGQLKDADWIWKELGTKLKLNSYPVYIMAFAGIKFKEQTTQHSSLQSQQPNTTENALAWLKNHKQYLAGLIGAGDSAKAQRQIKAVQSEANLIAAAPLLCLYRHVLQICEATLLLGTRALESTDIRETTGAEEPERKKRKGPGEDK